eukprot:6483980-Amphidinium_carterae.1
MARAHARENHAPRRGTGRPATKGGNMARAHARENHARGCGTGKLATKVGKSSELRFIAVCASLIHCIEATNGTSPEPIPLPLYDVGRAQDRLGQAFQNTRSIHTKYSGYTWQKVASSAISIAQKL